MTKLLTIGLLAALAAGPAFAQSQAPAEVRVVVRTGDLDLSSTAGRQALDRRLGHAVIEACGDPSNIDPAGANDIRRCRVDTSARIAADRDRLVRQASKGNEIILAAR